MKLVCKLAAAVASALLVGSASAGTIDLFDTPQAKMTDTTTGDGGLSSSVGLGIDPTIIGGERDMFVELLSKPVGSDLEARISVSAGAMNFSVDASATGTGIVQWDGADNSIALNKTGLGGKNIKLDGSNAFRVDTLFADLGFQFVIEAYTDANKWTRITFNSSNVAVPTTSYILFDGFENAGFCGANNPAPGVAKIECAGGNNPVDFTNLGALQLLIDPLGETVSVDLRLDSITTVPEPSVVALIGASMLGFGLSRRRRRA